ncbi:DUF6998 domain-containing protein [Hyphobacterium sp.]|uniref:DUF6998 domain-containing protein n=1 Tax=Hyphobacterium sp. TaxID=2004662 RepID=UPI0037482162
MAIADELRRRGITRSHNSPTGDLAEYLFCRAYDWQQAPNSEKSFDATMPTGEKVQIKACRLAHGKTSRQLSAIRNLESGAFQWLGGILFSHDYQVLKAALIPLVFVLTHATRSKHTNSRTFHLRDAVWDDPTVRDVTDDIRAARADIDGDTV